MRVHDGVVDCVVFIAIKLASGEYQVSGTGFWVSRPVDGAAMRLNSDGTGQQQGFTYLITAKHNVDIAKTKGVECLYLRVNTLFGEVDYFPVSFDLFRYLDDLCVDLAIARVGPLPVKRVVWSTADLIDDARFNEADWGIGTPVNIIGLFSRHSGRSRNVPILRSGHIAAVRTERVNTRLGFMDAYLVEAYSTGGLSGSPVGIRNASGQLLLLGVVHGHFDEEPGPGQQIGSVNAGIGVVIPADYIADLLKAPELMAEEAVLWQHYLDTGIDDFS